MRDGHADQVNAEVGRGARLVALAVVDEDVVRIVVCLPSGVHRSQVDGVVDAAVTIPARVVGGHGLCLDEGRGKHAEEERAGPRGGRHRLAIDGRKKAIGSDNRKLGGAKTKLFGATTEVSR